MTRKYFGYDDVEMTPIDYSNTPWKTKFFSRIFDLFWRGRWSYTTGEDDTCSVVCACGRPGDSNELFVTGSRISWCPVCGRGYRVNYEIRTYPSWLRRLLK